MIEKRFIKGYHTIRDTKKNKAHDFRVDIICDLLNELDEENKQLNNEIERLSHEQMCDADLIQQLRNSLNIDPYKEFIRYRNNFAEVCEELSEVNKEYGNLKRENEQLKQENKLKGDFRGFVTKDIQKTKEENEQLKHFIRELTTKGTAEIHLADGSIYKINTILKDFKGDDLND